MSDDSNPRLSAALAYAQRGWSVFPCLPRLKVPATPNGWVDSSTDPEKIRAWWRVNPNYNVAIATGPSNLFVVDVDPKGREAWVDLLETDSDLRALVGQSATVETPRGGVHVYMEGAGPSTVSKLAPGIDTRGDRGYVLATPSYVDDGKSKGHYTGSPHAQPLQPAYRPFLAKLVKPVVERTAPALPVDSRIWDAPETLTRATAWLEGLANSGDVAIEGAGGDQRTYEVACSLLEMAIRPDTAHRLMADLWNPHCAPPWDEGELLDKIRNAWKYGQETKGGKAERPMEETFAHLMTDDAPATPPDLVEAETAQKARYTPQLLKDARRNRKPLEWLVDDLIPRKGIGILYGPPETFKTFVLYDLAMSIATGHGPNWWQDGDREPQPVLFLAGESPDALVTKRTDAWLAKALIPGLEDRAQIYVVEGVPPFEMSDFWRHVIDWMKEHGVKPALVVIDTLTRAMAGWDENSAKDATRTTMKMEALSRELGAFVIAIHHSGKDVTRGARGSSVWLGNTDMMIEAERPNAAELSVLVHLRKLKEGGKTDLPLHFTGQIYGEAPAFERDWDFQPVTELPASTKHDTEEWAQPETLANILSRGPLTTEHLRDSIHTRFGIEKRIISKKLHDLKRGRYKAWVPEGDVWKIPDTHPAKVAINEEEF